MSVFRRERSRGSTGRLFKRAPTSKGCGDCCTITAPWYGATERWTRGLYICVFPWLKAVMLAGSRDITFTKDQNKVIKKSFLRVSLLSVTLRKGGEGGLRARGYIYIQTHTYIWLICIVVQEKPT